MSSELSIHINGETVKGAVKDFADFSTARIIVGKSTVTLYVWTKEREGLSKVLRELAESLAPTTCPAPFHPCPDCYDAGFRMGYEADRQVMR